MIAGSSTANNNIITSAPQVKTIGSPGAAQRPLSARASSSARPQMISAQQQPKFRGAGVRPVEVADPARGGAGSSLVSYPNLPSFHNNPPYPSRSSPSYGYPTQVPPGPQQHQAPSSLLAARGSMGGQSVGASSEQKQAAPIASVPSPATDTRSILPSQASPLQQHAGGGASTAPQSLATQQPGAMVSSGAPVPLLCSMSMRNITLAWE